MNEVDSHNKSRQSDLALEKWWVTQCGWLQLCTTVAMGMTITNCWKLFSYGVKREHYDKLIGIIEVLKRLAQDCFNNNFSSDSGTPAKNIPLLDEVDDEDTVYTCRSLQFSTSISPSAAVSTISDLTQSSASHFSEKEEAKLGGIYNRLTGVYGSRKFSTRKICLQRSLWFCNGCHGFNNKRVYYCRHVHRNCFAMHHDSLVRLP